MGLFQKFLARIWEIYNWKFERFTKNGLTSSVVELEKCSFFLKWVRISPEIDWCHYQGASPAPTCIVRHQTMTRTPTRWSVTSEPSVRGEVKWCYRDRVCPGPWNFSHPRQIDALVALCPPCHQLTMSDLSPASPNTALYRVFSPYLSSHLVCVQLHYSILKPTPNSWPNGQTCREPPRDW